MLYKRKAESPSVWAEKHRVLRMSSIPGKWRHVFTPYLAPLMDGSALARGADDNPVQGPPDRRVRSGFNLLGARCGTIAPDRP